MRERQDRQEPVLRSAGEHALAAPGARAERPGRQADDLGPAGGAGGEKEDFALGGCLVRVSCKPHAAGGARPCRDLGGHFLRDHRVRHDHVATGDHVAKDPHDRFHGVRDRDDVDRRAHGPHRVSALADHRREVPVGELLQRAVFHVVLHGFLRVDEGGGISRIKVLD